MAFDSSDAGTIISVRLVRPSLMNNDFTIIFSPDDDEYLSDGDVTQSVVSGVAPDFETEGFEPAEIQWTQGSAGYGADAVTLIATLGVLSAIFLSGKKIDENLDAWIKLGRRLKSLLTRLKEKYGWVAVSEPVALAIFLNRLNEAGVDLKDVEVLSQTTIPVRNESIPPEITSLFHHQPDRAYVFVLRVDERDTYACGMKSDGSEAFFHHFPTGNHRRFLSGE